MCSFLTVRAGVEAIFLRVRWLLPCESWTPMWYLTWSRYPKRIKRSNEVVCDCMWVGRRGKLSAGLAIKIVCIQHTRSGTCNSMMLEVCGIWVGESVKAWLIRSSIVLQPGQWSQVSVDVICAHKIATQCKPWSVSACDGLSETDSVYQRRGAWALIMSSSDAVALQPIRFDVEGVDSPPLTCYNSSQMTIIHLSDR